MTMDLADTHAAPIAAPYVARKRLFSWLLSIVGPMRRQQLLNDLPDRTLADLNIRRSEVATFDPRQVQLF